MAYHGAITYNQIFRRGCVSCPPTTPSCPDSCPDGQVCSLVPLTCNASQHTVCVVNGESSLPTNTPSPSSSSGPNVGAIVGGVVGGVVCIAIATYFVWRYCIKAKRQQYQQGEWMEQGNQSSESEKDFTLRRDARASTHTVGSIASTVLTRASNIIQIAYIPGVTNRSAPSTPGLLVPPVPPIPIALSAQNSPSHENEHFFMPGALRDSTYSGISDRTSYARNSVASTIYGKNAVVSPVPAQTVIRGKAAMVSVRQNGGRSGDATPPVPSVDFERFGSNGPPSPAFSVGSTFLNSATTATQVKARSIKTIGSNSTLKAQNQPANQTPLLVVTSEDGATQGASRDSNAITIIDDTPSLEQGPFGDPPAASLSTKGLSSVIEEAPEKDEKKGAKKAEGTPFGDENALTD